MTMGRVCKLSSCCGSDRDNDVPIKAMFMISTSDVVESIGLRREHTQLFAVMRIESLKAWD